MHAGTLCVGREMRRSRTLAHLLAVRLGTEPHESCLRAHPALVAVEHAVLRLVEHAAVLLVIWSGCSLGYGEHTMVPSRATQRRALWVMALAQAWPRP